MQTWSPESNTQGRLTCSWWRAWLLWCKAGPVWSCVCSGLASRQSLACAGSHGSPGPWSRCEWPRLDHSSGNLRHLQTALSEQKCGFSFTCTTAGVPECKQQENCSSTAAPHVQTNLSLAGSWDHHTVWVVWSLDLQLWSLDAGWSETPLWCSWSRTLASWSGSAWRHSTQGPSAHDTWPPAVADAPGCLVVGCLHDTEETHEWPPWHDLFFLRQSTD